MPETDETRERSKREVEQFISGALNRFKLAEEAEAKWRKEGLADLKFSVGEQWDKGMKRKRESEKKPCITINRIAPAIKQVTNNQRQQRPAIQINPAGDGASKEVADVLQGMVRHIEVQSDAEVAYDTSHEYMVRIGRAPFRIRSEYSDDTGDTLDQEIFIDPISNPFCLYTDPSAKRPDRADAKWKFIVDDISHDEYKADYGESDLAKMATDSSEFSSIGDKAPGWANKETVRVAEYFYIEYQEVKGKRRTAKKPIVKWAKINAIEILEEAEIPGSFIPIPEVVGDDLIVDGERYMAGLVRDAKEPAKVYNYQVTAACEILMLTPKAPFIGPRGAFNDPKWESANIENYAYLEYETEDANGIPITSPPQRNAVEAPILAISAMIRQADNDIKATSQLYDASLGKRGPDESGKAILERKSQGDMATFNYSDNLVRTIRFAGRILLQWIPVIYDAPRIQRIINPDLSVEHVGIYNSKSAGIPQGFDPKTHKLFEGIKKVFDIGVGKYDVTVSVGPSFQTKRQEAAAMQIELMKNVPSVQQAAPDIVIRNMDMPGADVIADRVKKLVTAQFPQLADDDQNSPEAQLQQAQSKLAALTQQHEALAQALTQATEEIKTKKVEQDTKLQIAKMDNETKLAVAEISTKAQDAKRRAEIELEVWKELHGSAHELAMQNEAHSNAQDLAAQNAAHQQDAAAQQASQQAEASPGQ